MEKSTRNFLLVLGISLLVLGGLFWYFSMLSMIYVTIFAIAGIILIIIPLYNWGGGTDFSAKQETPMENEDIQTMRDW